MTSSQPPIPARPTWTSGPPVDDAALEGYAQVLAESFGGDVKHSRAWIDRLGAERFRLVRSDTEGCLGGLGVLSIGMWVGGREVSCAGISAVAVAPHARGTGMAKALVRDALVEAHEAGVGLSSLYPSTLAVYRSVGYGQAGLRMTTRVPVQSLGPLAQGQRGLPVRRVTSTDRAAVEALHARVAAHHDGWLRRDAYLWSRVSRPRTGEAECYLIGPVDGPPEGHLGIQRAARPDGLFHDLVLTDVTLETPRAIERFWSFLASHGSVAVDVVLPLDPASAVVGALPEPTFHSQVSDAWMLRLVKLEAAFTQRGWRPGARGTLDLEVADPLLPANDGRWRVTVADGKAHVERGGDGALRLDMPGLASLYAGFRDVRELVQLGRAKLRDAAAGGIAEALFSGPAFTMPDRF